MQPDGAPKSGRPVEWSTGLPESIPRRYARRHWARTYGQMIGSELVLSNVTNALMSLNAG